MMSMNDLFANRKSISVDFRREFDRITKLAESLRNSNDVENFQSQIITLRNLSLKQLNRLLELLDERELRLEK